MTAKTKTRKILSTAELAEWVGCPRGTVYNYLREGKLPPCSDRVNVSGKFAGVPVWYVDDVLAYTELHGTFDLSRKDVPAASTDLAKKPRD